MREQNVRLHTKDGARKKVSVVTLRGLKQRGEKAAGAFASLLEAIPPDSAALIRAQLSIPVYGIGAGPDVDGQLVISHDLLGNFVGDITPRFVSQLALLDAVVTQAFGEYAAQVRGGDFLTERHCYAADASGWHTESDPLADFAVPVGAPTRPLLHTT